jgi:hypothetical protein
LKDWVCFILKIQILIKLFLVCVCSSGIGQLVITLGWNEENNEERRIIKKTVEGMK